MNELRLVYFLDAHVRGVSPRARTDNYFEAIIGKLAWLVTFANQQAALGPAALICGGDLFDGPDAAYSVTAAVAAVLQKARCDVLTVWGNHDLYGYSPESLGRTPLGLLARLGIVQLLTPNDGYYSVDHGVRITGRGFDWDMDKSIGDYAQKAGSPPAAIRIHVAHGMAVERPLPHEVRHTVLQEVPGTDIVLTGHEHLGYGVKRHGKTTWVNPGALGRLTARVEEIARKPQVALITCLPVSHPDGHDWKVQLIDVPCQPGSEVLSRDELREVAAREHRIAEFLDLLRSEAATTHLMDAPALIRYLADQRGFAPAICDEALRRLDSARSDLGGRRFA